MMHSKRHAQNEVTGLTNFRRITKKGETRISHFSVKDNLLLKGDNLIALQTIQKIYAGKVTLIYIDPPYNTGKGHFGYHDKLSHADWLNFMKSRIVVAKTFLSDSGSIWISIDDGEAHYLKVLCDEIFGRNNFIANVIWQKKSAPQNNGRYFSSNHDHILVYAKNKSVWKPNLLQRSDTTLARYANPDNDKRGVWLSGDLSVQTYIAAYDYPIIIPSGRVVIPPKGLAWRVSKQKFLALVDDNRVWFGKHGNSVPRIKRFLNEVKGGQTPLTIWLHTEVGHNQEAKMEVNKLLETDLFKTPKPERLLKRIIEIGSQEHDIVLDFFAGSGTTAVVALKLQRQFIAIEQMDYIERITKLRLRKVVEGERGGISQSVSWEGGGSFVFGELGKPICQKRKKSIREIEFR